MSIHYRVGIENITPNRAINREIWRYWRGLIPWSRVERMIETAVLANLISDQADPDVIKRVAREKYASHSR